MQNNVSSLKQPWNKRSRPYFLWHMLYKANLEGVTLVVSPAKFLHILRPIVLKSSSTTEEKKVTPLRNVQLGHQGEITAFIASIGSTSVVSMDHNLSNFMPTFDTHEMVQQMIVYAFSAFGFSRKIIVMVSKVRRIFL